MYIWALDTVDTQMTKHDYCGRLRKEVWRGQKKEENSIVDHSYSSGNVIPTKELAKNYYYVYNLYALTANNKQE